MALLFGLLVMLAALYGWLVGNWFARVLVFLILIVIGLMDAKKVLPDDAIGVIFLIGIPFMSWIVSGIPVYVRRWRLKAVEREPRLLLPGDLTGASRWPPSPWPRIEPKSDARPYLFRRLP